MNLIIEERKISLENDNKIYWRNSPIAKIIKGSDYLSPEIEVICDDSLDKNSRDNLTKFLKDWLSKYIIESLKDLINLNNLKISNQYLRALVFQMYENNGVIKRSEIEHIVKLISKEERKKLYNMGIKLGRYHVYIPKMLKPKAVTLRVNLWKLFYGITSRTAIPSFGLNFLVCSTSFL